MLKHATSLRTFVSKSQCICHGNFVSYIFIYINYEKFFVVNNVRYVTGYGNDRFMLASFLTVLPVIILIVIQQKRFSSSHEVLQKSCLRLKQR